ncbi:hypothetical protein AK830_g1273 [Neonectria ditissima]|uniref:alpha-galactosidase n=1 Tax=Neonectria ditissima TaxID=78410 RepID=A0A0P7BUN0_9HYPO|nr:hypothetical protein AK830_g1273 [Neonectria ditissima]
MENTQPRRSSLTWKTLALAGLQMVAGSPLRNGTGINVAEKAQPRRGSADIDVASRQYVWKPSVGDSWQIVLSSPIKANSQTMSPDVKVWDLDLYDNDVSTFQALQNAGRKVVCYFSAGSYENYRDDAGQFKKADLGKVMDGWPDERWLDTRTANVRNIMKQRIAYAADKGCNAIDPDNVDGYGNDTGFKLKKADSVNYLKFLAKTAASYGMSIGLKNSAEIVGSVVDFIDFAVVEQCVQYSECDTYSPFIDNGKPVFHIEYPRGAPNKVSSTTANNICQSPDTDGFSTIMKKLSLDGWARLCGGQTYTTKTL